jgi:putative nucleotidyltransferase with HDIG domain
MEIPEFIKSVVERLRAAGYQTYIVGGAVRDHCLQRTVTDWDVASSATPEEIKSTFPTIRHFSLKHGTVTLVHSERNYEVTTFRGSKGFGHSIEEDLRHRDFTINAMAYDEDLEKILDPCGGREDLFRRLIRAVGDPNERCREDPLRLLRAVRLATELEFRIESNTLETISRMAEQLEFVAPERIREELLKILLSQRPSVGFNLMFQTGLLREFLPELLEGYRKKQDASHRYTIYKHIMETLDQVEPDPVLRLTALLHDIAKPRVRKKIDGEFRFLRHEEESATLGKKIMERLRFNHEMIGQVTQLILHHMSLVGYDTGWSDGALRRLVRRVGSEKMDHLLAFRKADILAHGKDDEKMGKFSELKERIESLRSRGLVQKSKDLAIDGYEVMEILGLSEGPEVGRILEQLVDRVSDHPKLNTKGRLITLLEEMKQINGVKGA